MKQREDLLFRKIEPIQELRELVRPSRQRVTQRTHDSGSLCVVRPRPEGSKQGFQIVHGFVAGIVGVLGCGPDTARLGAPPHDAVFDEGREDPDVDAEDVPEEESVEPWERVRVRVWLDGEPAAGAVVVQGGEPEQWRTDERGEVDVTVRWDRPGGIALHGSAPSARIAAVTLDRSARPTADVDIQLVGFGPDNPDVLFADPGEPFRRPTTEQCSHCHISLGNDWYGSVHRSSATNPRVWDLYLGIAAEASSPEACEALGGRWEMGELARGGVGMRCSIDEPEQTACADCHAPGIDGQVGGRRLLEAEGISLDYGVHCDVCHKVESVHPEAPPGVAGRLRIHRPSEPASFALGGGGFLPLGFGPNHDVANPRMGQVQRDHFADGQLCVGCHELEGGQPADPLRWPNGSLPLQSTWSEWESGRMHGIATCVDCHMPPRADQANGSELQAFWPLTELGVQGGWPRPPGSVRSHAFLGPRTVGARMVELAVAVFAHLEPSDDGGWDVAVTVRNAAAGHAIPTGEAMRTLVMEVDLRCDGVEWLATGGDVVPEWAGAERRLDTWHDLNPEEGDVLRLVRRLEGLWHAYDGVAPFDRETGWTSEARGLPVEVFVGAWTWTDGAWRLSGSASPDVTLPHASPEAFPEGEPGLVGYLIRDPRQRAGRPGFAFARVLVDEAGRRLIASTRATDLRSDNRLMPQAEWTSHHRFAPGCDSPEVEARVWYVPYPEEGVRGRGWPDRARVVARAVVP